MPKDKNINKNELAPKGRYAKLTLDLTFKKAFASKKYSDLLITLLNTFLKKKLAHPIKAIRINNPYVQGETKDNRDAIFDIHCQDSKGNSFIVEMQMAKQAYFIKRTLFYLCMAVANSAPKSKGWNFDFPRVYSLNFINFDLDFGEGNDEIVQYLSLSNETNPKIRYTYINLVYVRLTKFKKTIEECRSLHDKLLFSLRNMHKLKEQPKQLKGTFFDMLFSVAEFSSFSPMELTEYMSRTMARFDRSAQLEYAKDTGIKAGMRKGRKLGIEQGREEGITQTAKNMLAKGYSIADIIGITDLSREQIKALKRGLMPTH